MNLRPEDLESVYAFVRAYIEEHTHPPTIREIGRHCLMSRANVVRYLDRLEAQGRIFREPGRARGITLVKPEDL